jgi:hypothetical protein
MFWGLNSVPVFRWNILSCVLNKIQDTLSICSLLSINVTKSFTFLLFVDTTCFGLTRPSSGVIVHFTEAGALLMDNKEQILSVKRMQQDAKIQYIKIQDDG